MLEGPWFARASYTLFAVAVFAAVVKIGGMSGAEPVLLQIVPAKPVAAEAPPLEEDLPTRPLLDLPEPGDGQGELVRPSQGQNLGSRLEARAGFAEAPSVFRRPYPDGAPAGPVCGDLGAFPESSRVVFPLPRRYFDSYEPGWGSPRPQGGHEGTDLMGPIGVPEFAVTDGTVVEVAGANENGWNRLGGYTVMIRADYDVGPIREGDLFYYAHMDRESALPAGTRVRAGQRLGSVGDTGEGPEATRGKFPSHLHLGWYDGSADGPRSKVESGAMDPYPLLLWLEENGGAVSGGTDASYCEAPQGPVPTSNEPGESPDMDTGDDRDARPSPIVAGNRAERRDRPSGRDDEPAKPAGRIVRPGDAVSAPEKNARATQPVEVEDREHDGDRKNEDDAGKDGADPTTPPDEDSDREPPDEDADGEDREDPGPAHPDLPKEDGEPQAPPDSPEETDDPEPERPETCDEDPDDEVSEETGANSESSDDEDAEKNTSSDEQPEPGDRPPDESQDEEESCREGETPESPRADCDHHTTRAESQVDGAETPNQCGEQLRLVEEDPR